VEASPVDPSGAFVFSSAIKLSLNLGAAYAP
jgi:hypothetical protein